MSLIMKKDFLVKVAKGSGIVEFTQQHLDTHLRFFNEETKPEYFGDLQPFGLDYDRTVLIEDIIINHFIDRDNLDFKYYLIIILIR